MASIAVCHQLHHSADSRYKYYAVSHPHQGNPGDEKVDPGRTQHGNDTIRLCRSTGKAFLAKIGSD